MPARLAAFFSSIRDAPGSLSNHGRHLIIIAAVVILGVATAVFVRTTWDAELSNDVITFTALFVGTALVLVGFARKRDTKESWSSSRSEEVPAARDSGGGSGGSTKRKASSSSSREVG